MNQVFSTSPRIAFVDLTFNWPPVGGCWIDAFHVIQGLHDRGAEVRLFIPEFQTYYPRGAVSESLPFDLVKIPFNRFTFNFSTVLKRFRHCVDQYQPDMIFILDGYFMKNALLSAFGAHRCFLRFYSYELFCINLHYYRYHENRICDKGFLEHPRECHRCWFHRMPAAGRAFQIALGMKDRHPKLHFSQEYLFSGAFTETYRQQLIQHLSGLRGAIVYNDFMQQLLAPYVENISIIPSGVDCTRFTPSKSNEPKDRNPPVRIFLPGRANDSLKGLPILIQAGEWLEKHNVSFEIHYTAAMDCPTTHPWLINQGWVDQDQLPLLYQQMDIVVVPSTWIEPFGITALEGMASGLPVVASRIGGLATTTLHNETGLLVEPENPLDMAMALRSLIRDPGQRKQFGQKGRQRALEQYEWNHILDRHYVPIVENTLADIKPTSRIVEKIHG